MFVFYSVLQVITDLRLKTNKNSFYVSVDEKSWLSLAGFSAQFHKAEIISQAASKRT